MTPTGLERTPQTHQKPLSSDPAAQNPAHFRPDSDSIDPDLRRVIVAWPGLPDAVKRQVLLAIGPAARDNQTPGNS